MRSYSDFKLAVRIRESSNDYECVNKLGFLGAYQFGMARLCDLGLTRRSDPGSTGLKNSDFYFSAMTKEEFLSSPPTQDACFDMHIHRLKFSCLKKYPMLKDGMLLTDGTLLDLSGAIMVCHLVGPGSLNLLIEGVDVADAMGTKASDYSKLFFGYEIPE